jgi:hypothetical protein
MPRELHIDKHVRLQSEFKKKRSKLKKRTDKKGPDYVKAHAFELTLRHLANKVK